MDKPSGLGPNPVRESFEARRSERRDDGEEAIRREVAVLPAGVSVAGAPSWGELQVASVLSG